MQSGTSSFPPIRKENILHKFMLQASLSSSITEELECIVDLLLVESSWVFGAESLSQLVSGCISCWLRILHSLQKPPIKIAIGNNLLGTSRCRHDEILRVNQTLASSGRKVT